MTPDNAFECLLVSRDPGLFSTMSRILRDLSISVEVCLSSAKACQLMGKNSAELIVIDWEGEDSSELLQKIRTGRACKTPTVMAISSLDRRVPGAHVVLKKPVTIESGTRSLRSAYSRMLMDYRRHARFALMMPVVAQRDDGRPISLTVVDIGDGGVGLSTKETLNIGDSLSFRLQLPRAERDILIQVRILWTRDYGRVGCEFLRIPPVDLTILLGWLKGKSQIKKPLAEVWPANH
jgi:hypothetical protein